LAAKNKAGRLKIKNLFSAALALLLVYTAAGRAEELDAKKMLLAKKFDEYINSCE